MTALRRLSYAVFGVACTHLVFGAIVRISGSGMGCGPHWPKCYGRWFPPFDRPDLVIEVLHRYLASILLLSLVALVVVAWSHRAARGVGGPRGVLRAAALALALGVGAALLGAVTVKLGNSAPATVAHWTIAMSLVATVTAAVIRAGGFGGASASLGGASAKTRRATLAGAALALAAVVMGGLTAKVQGGPIACLAFPHCGANPAVPRGAVHVQSTHRLIAVLLVLHLVGLFFALRKRGEARVIRRAASIALGLGVLQLLIAGAMIGMHLPPALRSLHQATGVSIWIATFALAYLARLASDDASESARILRGPVAPGALPAPARSAASLPTPDNSGRALPAPDNSAQALRDASSARPSLAQALAITEAEVAPVSPSDTGAAGQMRVSTPSHAMAAVVAPAPRRASADEPIELADAIAHAERLASRAAIGFHGVASAMAVAPAEVEETVANVPQAEASRADQPEPDVAVPSPGPAEVVASVTSGPPAAESDDVDRDHRYRSPVAIIDRSLSDPTLLARTLLAERLLAASVEAVAQGLERAAPGEEPVPVEVTVTAPSDAGPALADATTAEWVDAEPEPARGGPPAGEVSELAAQTPNHPAAPVTIFDAVAAEDADDPFYNLRDLDDADDEDEAVAAEHVPTLDEEFSLRAAGMSAHDDVDAPRAPVPDAALAAPVIAPALTPFSTVSAIAAGRRPAMSHSVAVIVARGADC